MHPVGQADEQNEFVRRVVPVDVQCGIGLGVAQVLGLLEGHVKIQTIGGHFGQDVVARAVENAHEGLDAVAREAFLEGFHNGHGSGHAGLVAQDAPLAVGLLEQRKAFLGQQGLVGGDNVLALVKSAVNEVTGMVNAAHKLHQHVDFGIVREVAGIGGQFRPVGQGYAARLLGIAHQNLLEQYVPTGTAADKIRVFLDQAYQAAAHCAESGQAHYQWLVAVLGHDFSESAR